jgi:Bacterial PH domain
MRRVYRPTIVTRVVLVSLGVAVVLLSLFVLAVASFADGSDRERLWTILFALALGVLGALQLFLMRVRLVADDDGVEIVNYVSRRRFRWDQIDRFEVGFAYWGISLVPRSGPPVKVNAVQKTNLYHWLGRPGRADTIVAELNGLLAERTSPPVPPPPPPRVP